MSDDKKCLSHCPQCGAGIHRISWGGYEWLADTALQSATCILCGCEFNEIYKYSHSEITSIGKTKDK